MSQKKKSPHFQGDADLELLLKAVNASNASVTVADASRSDVPLIFINQAFEKLTGYHPDEVLGKNCRFLQGDDTDQFAVKEIRKSIQAKTDCVVVLKNYKKNGEPFWNELHISPVFNSERKVTHFVGVQTDVTDRVLAEAEVARYREQLEELVAERTAELEDKNTALQVLIGQIELEKKKVKDQVVQNVDSVVLPLLSKMKLKMKPADSKYVDLIRKNLEELTSSYGVGVARKLYRLSPREIEICDMIRNGLSSKDIANFYHVALSTIENQRNAIRKKLDISKKGVNLTSYLQSLGEDLSQSEK